MFRLILGTPKRESFGEGNGRGGGGQAAVRRLRQGPRRLRHTVGQSLKSNKGPIGYSDSAGKPKKCHSKQLLLYPMIFSTRRYFLGPKNC